MFRSANSRPVVIAAIVLVVFSFLSLSPSGLAKEIPVYGYSVIRSFPHDPTAFTQGLFFKDGYLYESTGHYGQSTIRKVELETGKIVKLRRVPAHVFGEGITEWNGRLIGLTWRNHVGFEWDLVSFERTGQFSYAGEGWGLTHSNSQLIMSDGTSWLRFLDPVTLKEGRRVQVVADGKPVKNLNELEWVDGEVFANIWQTDLIARIDPKDGKVRGWIDLSGLLETVGPVGGNPDVLNGIASDGKGRLFVTGKRWPVLFEITLVTK